MRGVESPRTHQAPEHTLRQAGYMNKSLNELLASSSQSGDSIFRTQEPPRDAVTPATTFLPGAPLNKSSTNDFLPQSSSSIAQQSAGQLQESAGQDPHTLRLSLQRNIGKIQEGALVKEACISEIFFCHTQDEFSDLVAAFDQGDDSTVPPAVKSEMYAAAATSGQYVRDLLGPGLLDPFYSKSFMAASMMSSTLRCVTYT